MPFNLYPAMSVKTPLDFQQQNEEVKSARLSNMINDFKLQQAQREQQQQQALATLYQTLGPGLASGDPNALEKLSHVDPTAAQNFQKGALANQSAEQKSQVDMLDLAAKRAAYIGDSAAAVLQAPEPMRPLMYQRALMDAKAQGIDISNLPQQYDPAVVQGIMTKALGAKETFDMQLRTAQQQEIERHNVATESQQRAALGETIRKNKADEAAAGAGADISDLEAIDPTSGSILAQTGLPMNAFMYLTGKSSQLPRDKNTRNIAARQAEAFANKKGVDVSTFASQYQAYNNVLQQNIQRVNNTRIMEGELQGTIENLKPVADAAAMGALQPANVVKLFAGEKFSDPTVAQYRFQLNQLRGELAGYIGAIQGRTGASLTKQDYDEAAQVIVNGLNSGAADGLEKAVSAATEKMTAVMNRNIDVANKAVWDLFGVGSNYKPRYAEPAPTTANAGASGQQQNIPRVTNDAEYNKLPSGTVFVGPDGKQRRKP